MLKELYIENYLLINELDISFSRNLNIITGETGAGKSILLGAISMIMGGKSDSGIAKDKEKKTVLEGTFDVTEMKSVLEPYFKEEEIDFDQEMVIRRVISTTGKSKFFVNQEPVSMSFLRSIGNHLIDIHSQHQTLLLGSIDFQISVLDSVAKNTANLVKYENIYAELKKAENELLKLIKLSKQSKDDEEYLTFQYNQLESAKLSIEEFEQMEAQYQILSNSQMISENMYSAVNEISQQDNSILQALGNTKSYISKIVEYVPSAGDYIDRLDSVIIELKDINRECETILDSISNNPNELDRIALYLDTLNSLLMKHKVSSITELIDIRDSYKRKLDLIGDFETNIAEAEKRVLQITQESYVIAEKLSTNRNNAKDKLEHFVIDVLKNLGMPNSVLSVSISKESHLTKHGIDNVEFLFSANKGIQCESITKVASGGEMSRLMLALKALMSSSQNMATLIFDEIDSGVSGQVADKMGEIIMNMANNRQIVNITHLPQVAAKGDTHLFVYKEHTETESVTNIKKLTIEERIQEIASMLSGEKMTNSAIAQAKELLR